MIVRTRWIEVTLLNASFVNVEKLNAEQLRFKRRVERTSKVEYAAGSSRRFMRAADVLIV